MAGSRKSKKGAELRSEADPGAPLDGAGFLAAAQPVLSLLTADLLERADASAGVTAELRRAHAEEAKAGRTAEAYEVWRRERIVQVAAAWLLSCVFVRVLEDRGLLGRHRLAGPGAEDSQRQFGELAPYLGARDYLLTIFRELARIPATAPLFDARHNLVWRLSPSQGGAQALLNLLRAPQADAPAFRFGQADTRFLGDLYQDLSADVRETYALLQTPDFVEAFILDRTLEPAIAEYGVDAATILDPTCGSGHFLLGAFARLLDRLRHAHPGLGATEVAKRALGLVHGVDLNPYAVAIARFRLTLAFWEAIGVRRLGPQSAPPPLHVVVGDSLLFAAGEQTSFADLPGQTASVWYGPTFAFDDEEVAKALLSRRYAAVVGNPPYITVKDAALRETYRKLYAESAAGKYALSAPFLQRFFQLARPGGFTGQITSNAFMKREFGKKLVETVLPRLDLTLVVNTAGAYIPGHGTPTVILCGRNRRPEGPGAGSVCAVLSKRGEPSTPADPAKGEVWSSIVQHWHEVGYDGEYISVEAVRREVLDKHPWSLEGGGAGALKELLEARAEKRLGDVTTSIGFMAITGEDDAFTGSPDYWVRQGVELEWVFPFGVGESIRDWGAESELSVFFPYRGEALKGPDAYPRVARLLWPLKRLLLNRPDFSGKKYIDVGRPWYSLHQVPLERLKTPLSIAFAFVATHNHFVLDRGGKVFNRTAPIIKLPEGASEEDHLALLAYLNSSTAQFWCRQTMANRGYGADANNARTTRVPWEDFYEYASTLLKGCPLPPGLQGLSKLGAALDSLAQERARCFAYPTLRKLWIAAASAAELRGEFDRHAQREVDLLQEMLALQEELDWAVYRRFELSPGGTHEHAKQRLPPGCRAFERVLASQGAIAFQQWLGQPGYATDSFGDLPVSVRKVVEERTREIEGSKSLRLLEQPEHKRRWRATGVTSRLRAFVLDSLAEEGERCVSESNVLVGADRIAESCSSEAMVRLFEALGDFVGAVRAEVQTLLARESVPFLAAHRYTDAGLEKFALWEETWALQRREDLGEKVGEIRVPPKYDPKDFRDGNFYRLRGKLDVPKERFISYPGCESDEDGEPIFGWAGWDHLQRAAALVDLYYKRKDGEGWAAERLVPILAGLLELLPWLKQWHNAPDADGARMGDEYEAVLDEEVRQLGLTREKLREWRPVAGRVGRGRKAAADARTEAASGAPETEAPEAAAEVEAEAVAAPKRRGRPPKVAAGEGVTTETVAAAPKRRGRPPKVAEAEALATEARPKNGGLSSAPAETGDVPTAKRRGRPPKSAVGEAPPLAPAASTPPLARGETAPESVPAREASSGPAPGPARGPTREAAAPPVPAPTPAEPVPKTKRGRPRKGSEGSLDLFGGDSDP